MDWQQIGALALVATAAAALVRRHMGKAPPSKGACGCAENCGTAARPALTFRARKRRRRVQLRSRPE